MIALFRRWLGLCIPLAGQLAQYIFLRRMRNFQKHQRSLSSQFSLNADTPICGYSDLEEDIVHFVSQKPSESIIFAETSGTTGTPKRIPYTRTRIRTFKLDSALAGMISFKHYKVRRSDLYVLSSRKQDRSFTALTMHQGSPKPNWIKALIYPSAHERDPSLEPLYQQYGGVAVRLWLMMLTEPGILYCTNPSTLSVFLESVYVSWNENRRILVDWGTNQMPEGDWSGFVSRLGTRRTKEELLRIGTLAAAPEFSILFPYIQAFCSWDGGYVGRFIDQIRRRVPPKILHIPMYSMSTETVQTLPVIYGSRLVYLPIVSNVRYEFIALNGEGDISSDILEPWELTKGEEYIMLVSNEYGLRRYQTDDVFLCLQMVEGVPDLRFLRREGLRWSFTGEKITGEQIQAVWDILCSEIDLTGYEMTLIPHFPAKATCPNYILCLAQVVQGEVDDCLAHRFDAELQKMNSEYRSKRESGRLGCVDMEIHAYSDIAAILDTRTNSQDDIEKAVWESQFKLPPLWRKLRT